MNEHFNCETTKAFQETSSAALAEIHGVKNQLEELKIKELPAQSKLRAVLPVQTDYSVVFHIEVPDAELKPNE